MKSLSKISFKSKPANVFTTDDGKTVIEGVSIVTAGEALGHDVHLDNSFIAECYSQAMSLKLGLKSRFGHPTMCNESLGTYIGRFKNFALVDEGARLVGDIHLAESAKNAPGGDLHEYVSKFAQEDPDAFGTSIVFEPGDLYFINEDGEKDFEGDAGDRKVFATCKKLFGSDFVDEPAANPGGLFSEYNMNTVAGQLGQFFEGEPEVLSALLDNPEIIDIIRLHGSKVEIFLNKIKELDMAEENAEQTEEEVTLEADTEQAEQPETSETEETETEVEQTDDTEVEQEEFSLSQYREMVSQFGTVIADQVVDQGEGIEFAQSLKIAELESKVTDLEKQLGVVEKETDFRKQDSGDGASFTEGQTKPKRSLTTNMNL